MNEPAGDDKDARPQISVVIVAYRSGPTLQDCLDKLEAQSFRDFEVILVDNASPDGEARAAAKAFPHVRLIENAENLGFAGANNQGARAARGRWLVLLNPDAFAEPDWLAELAAAAARWPKVRAFTSRQVMDDDPAVLDGLGDVMSGPCIPYRGGYLAPDTGDAAEGEVFSPCGAAMMVDRNLFLALGGFDEAFFCYCEDVDLGYRLQLAGEPTLLAPRAVVRHVGSASSGGRRSEFAVFHGTRNRFWVLIKDTPLMLMPLVLPLHFAAVAFISSHRANRPQLKTILKAYGAAISDLPRVLRDRAAVQAARKVSAWRIARSMTWNPADLRGRRAVVSPLRPNRRGGA
jgi:GT2 family glycosyltransferase